MKTMQRAIKLFCPMGPFVLWTKWRHPKLVLKERAAIRGVLKCIWWIVPYGVFCVNAQAAEKDKHEVKYWLPYGLMCRHVAKRYGYAVIRGHIRKKGRRQALERTLKSERKHSLIARFTRNLMPYGLVLWQDRSLRAEQKASHGKCLAVLPPSATSAEVRALAQQVKALDDHLKRVEGLVNAKSDNLEIQLLKLRLAVKELAGK